MMRTSARDFALLYFENHAPQARAAGWSPDAPYTFTWFDPRTGEWRDAIVLRAGANGEIQLPPFPGGANIAATDWAAKIVARKGTN